jgi:hypothetical protein
MIARVEKTDDALRHAQTHLHAHIEGEVRDLARKKSQ